MTLCDAGGNWLESVVLPANTGERAGALILFEKVKAAWWSRRLSLIWADKGFGGVDFEEQVKQQFGWTLDIGIKDGIKDGIKEPGQKGFCVQRKRWLIEQVFGCWGRYRRLSRDYEQNTHCSRATLQVATLHRWLRRLRPAQNPDPPFRYR
jgi:putative transposase